MSILYEVRFRSAFIGKFMFIEEAEDDGSIDCPSEIERVGRDGNSQSCLRTDTSNHKCAVS